MDVLQVSRNTPWLELPWVTLPVLGLCVWLLTGINTQKQTTALGQCLATWGWSLHPIVLHADWESVVASPVIQQKMGIRRNVGNTQMEEVGTGVNKYASEAHVWSATHLSDELYVMVVLLHLLTQRLPQVTVLHLQLKPYILFLLSGRNRFFIFNLHNNFWRWPWVMRVGGRRVEFGRCAESGRLLNLYNIRNACITHSTLEDCLVPQAPVQSCSPVKSPQTPFSP